MNEALDSVLKGLTPIQQTAVEWNAGAALVLAGPGAGKTRVLTSRIARILEESRGKNFRILALTFTIKAATEMRERVEALVPGLTERAFIGTFHAFCTQVLRQHGSHIGIQPDFGIYDQDKDRESLLIDALREAAARGEKVTEQDVRWLKVIDNLKSKLVLPDKVAPHFRVPTEAAKVALVYGLYQEAMGKHNVMDFNGLILETCRLVRDIPEVAARLRQAYPYWLIDEFQDTSPAQSKFLRLLADGKFHNVFAVADDDQIIYQWAGASYKQIEIFRDAFRPELIQLVENYRCPPEIVESANLLVAHNTQRTPNKQPLIATRPDGKDTIVIRTFEDDTAEQEGIASEIAAADKTSWGKTAVLGRTRSMLAPVLESLKKKGVKATLAQRRDRFISSQFVWLQACLDQALRPSDKQVFIVMIEAANRAAGMDNDPLTLIAEAEAAGRSYFEHWGLSTAVLTTSPAKEMGEFAQRIAQSRVGWKKAVSGIIPVLLQSAGSDDGIVSDAADDAAAWKQCLKEIKQEKGEEPELAEVVQGLALRSKEPPADPDAVAVLTVHAAKGLEFDFVYVVGMAESVMPSWQSVGKGEASAEMEEERRNCFVAITRTRERLTLSRAKKYKGWQKEPSRFLKEMGFVQTQGS